MWNILRNIFSFNKARAVSTNGQTILVIDDGEVERQFMVRSLAKVGYTVHTRSDGDSGLEAARSLRPDIIILDYLMPGMDGQAVCRKLKSDPQTRNIPVIFLTGSSRPETVITCYDIGADQYLSKPISAKALTDQVQTTLAQNPPPDQKGIANPAEADKIETRTKP